MEKDSSKLVLSDWSGFLFGRDGVQGGRRRTDGLGEVRPGDPAQFRCAVRGGGSRREPDSAAGRHPSEWSKQSVIGVILQETANMSCLVQTRQLQFNRCWILSSFLNHSKPYVSRKKSEQTRKEHEGGERLAHDCRRYRGGRVSLAGRTVR